MPSPVVEILGELWELPDPALRDRWARCVRPDARGRQLPGGSSPYHWTSEVTVRSIKARAGEWLMFHAAGVSDDEGAVTALIGASGTGKSTAARTLCQDDFGYVTDETVAVLSNGAVVPFPKPIAVIPPEGGDKLEFGPEELGLRRSPAALTMNGLVLLERKSNSIPVIERLGLLEGILATVPHMSALPHMPSALARLADLAGRCGGLHRVIYSDAAQLPDVVREVLATGPARSDWHQQPSCPVPEMPGLVRAEHHDAIELEGDVLILQGSTCLLFRGVAALAWLAADRPRSFDDIVAAVVDAAGEHPNAAQLVQTAVDELVTQGVLVSR